MTKFEYACFISYRNSRHVEGLISSFANELAIALEQYLDAHLIDDIGKADNNFMVFLDNRIIESGDFLPPILGQGLYKSLCWIVVFTPNYLRGSLWCASELNTMLSLEEERFQRLGIQNPAKRFVIPLMLRGKDEDVPLPLKNHIFNHNFRKFLLSHKNIGQHDLWASVIDELAETIADRQRIIKQHSKNSINLCDNWDTCSLTDVNTASGRAEIESFVQKFYRPQSSNPQMPIS